jgi:hypothetical protein
MRQVVLVGVFLGLFARVLPATTVGVYLNRADWEAAMGTQGAGSLATIGFNNSQWTDSIQLSSNFTALVSQSTTAASNGMSISAISGYSSPGWVDNSTLGHVANGMWTDNLSKYGSTTFNFSDSIYGFGGDFDIGGGNGLYLSSGGEVPYPTYNGKVLFGSAYPGYNGFIGIISNQPMDSILISWGDNGSCAQCFGNSYTLSNLAVDIIATPEPNFQYVFVGLVILAASYFLFKRA